MRLFEIKEYISRASDVPHDSLHIHMGLALYLCARVLFQGRGGAIVAFSLVVTVALISEMSDFAINNNGFSTREPDHFADLFATCLWPAVLCIVRLLDIRGARIKGGSEKSPAAPPVKTAF